MEIIEIGMHQNRTMATRLIQRQSSIENEPRTLNLNQIEFAREAALYVVKTKSKDEALSVFTEGLEPVVRACEDEGDPSREEDECFDMGGRDVATAPF